MFVLHVLWDGADDGRLHLWIEQPPRAKARLGQHPGARGHSALIRAVSAWLGKGVATRAEISRLTLLLPTHTQDGAPLSSPELGLNPPGAAGIDWQAWRIPTLSPHNPSIALRRLAQTRLPEQIVLGASAQFWLSASALVDDLISRDRFAPYAGDDERTLLARWSPVYDTAASAQLRALAAAMPGVCRAIAPPGATPALHRPPDAMPLLTHFLERILDRRARPKMRPTLRRAAPKEDHNIAARWLRRLAGPSASAYVLVKSIDHHEFGEALRAWLAPFHVLPQARGRLCVQLDEPSEDGQHHWRLAYFLQDVDEPSVLIPARQIWHHDSRDALLAQRRFIAASKTLLAGLSQAAALCPPIAESLRLAMPEGTAIMLEQAHAFLREQAATLEAAGIGVRLPAWWRQKRDITVELKMDDREAFFGVETLVKFNWQAALGDVVLTRAEFETLSRLKAPLAQVRGQWVEVNADNLRRALRYFDKHKKGLTVTEALRAAANGASKDIGLDVAHVDVRGHLRMLMERLRGARRIAPVQPAKAFAGELRPYQERGLSWLAFLSEYGLGACLADDMGLGKTVQLLALVEHWRANDAQPGPVLLICPMSIIGNWQREASRFTPDLKVLVHHGGDRLDGPALRKAARQHDLVLTTYALAHRDVSLLRGVTWRAVVLDEAQNIKNHDAKQTKAIRSIETRQRIALTGTPVENRLSELWSILDFLNPGCLGPRESFYQNYARGIERGDSERSDELRRLVQPFLLRRVKTDKTILSDLPDKTEHTVYCNLTREQATLYQAVTRDMLDQIADAEGLARARLILVALTKLKQICNHPAHYLGDGSRMAGRSGKLARIEAMLEEALSAGDKALIFSQYTAMASPLAAHLHKVFKREVLFLHGGTPKRKRDEMVWRFQEEPNGPPVFVLSLKAGGTGLNLTAANHVFHYDRWWNPAVEMQATDRTYRIGQKRDVQVHKLVCLGTLEERIDQLLTKKRALASAIIGEGEGWLTELSTQQLRDMFALGREAIGD
jgi:superfamily II DNA or RNA helicase